MDIVWFVLAGIVACLLGWWGLRMDPHWASKDGRTCICRIQRLDERGIPEGNWHEARISIGSSVVELKARGLARRRGISGRYVVRQAGVPSKKKLLYLLEREDEAVGGHVVVRIPATSRSAPHLEAALIPL